MKRAIRYIILPVLLFCSCKKEHSQSTSSAKKYPVTLNVSGFSQTISNVLRKQQTNSLQTNSTGSSPGYSVIVCDIYGNASTFKTTQVYQDSSASNFGTIQTELADGDYTFYFVAGQATLHAPSIINGYIFGYPNIGNPWQDTFTATVNATVSGGGLSENVSLNRITGKVAFDLQDKIPANASYITLTVDPEYDYWSFIYDKVETTYTETVTQRMSIPASAIGTTNYTNGMFVLNTVTPFNVTISCYDSGNNLIAQKLVPNVTVARNTETILKGSLFGTGPNFSVSLNQAWGTPTNIGF